jgi:hypothetical protein
MIDPGNRRRAEGVLGEDIDVVDDDLLELVPLVFSEPALI